VITTVMLFTCCCYGTWCQPIRQQLSNDVGRESSTMLKVVRQKKLADFMLYDRFLLADIVGRQKSAVVGQFFSFVWHRLNTHQWNFLWSANAVQAYHIQSRSAYAE